MQRRVRPVIQRIVNQIGTPAIVRNSRADYLTANQLGPSTRPCSRAASGRPTARGSRSSIPRPSTSTRSGSAFPATSWPTCAPRPTQPYDRGLSDLVGELATRSDEFRVRWAAHNVRFHRTGVKRLHHPVVGDLTLNYETMELPADDGLTMSVYTAEPGSVQQALDILASWTATADYVGSAAVSDEAATR